MAISHGVEGERCSRCAYRHATPADVRRAGFNMARDAAGSPREALRDGLQEAHLAALEAGTAANGDALREAVNAYRKDERRKRGGNATVSLADVGVVGARSTGRAQAPRTKKGEKVAGMWVEVEASSGPVFLSGDGYTAVPSTRGLVLESSLADLMGVAPPLTPDEILEAKQETEVWRADRDAVFGSWGERPWGDGPWGGWDAPRAPLTSRDAGRDFSRGAEMLRALDALPAPERATILAKHADELTVTEVERLTGDTRGVVRGRLKRAEAAIVEAAGLPRGTPIGRPTYAGEPCREAGCANVRRWASGSDKGRLTCRDEHKRARRAARSQG